MITFRMLLEQMDDQPPSPLMSSGEESRAMSVIRSGNDLRNDEETPFWNDFVNLCVNADGMSELFGVPPEQIRSWPDRIQEMLDKVQSHDAQSPSEQQNDTEVLPTGDNGAVTMNSDPHLGG